MLLLPSLTCRLPKIAKRFLVMLYDTCPRAAPPSQYTHATSSFFTPQISKRFPTMPFTLRALAEGAEGEAKQELSAGQLRLGLVECLNHGLLQPYPVLHEKAGDLVAQVGGWVWGQGSCVCCMAYKVSRQEGEARPKMVAGLCMLTQYTACVGGGGGGLLRRVVGCYRRVRNTHQSLWCLQWQCW